MLPKSLESKPPIAPMTQPGIYWVKSATLTKYYDSEFWDISGWFIARVEAEDDYYEILGDDRSTLWISEREFITEVGPKIEPPSLNSHLPSTSTNK